jgi:hypothetical protein
VSSHMFIAQQVMGNNAHELTKGGSSCEVRLIKKVKVEAEHCFYKLVKILLALTKCK